MFVASSEKSFGRSFLPNDDASSWSKGILRQRTSEITTALLGIQKRQEVFGCFSMAFTCILDVLTLHVLLRASGRIESRCPLMKGTPVVELGPGGLTGSLLSHHTRKRSAQAARKKSGAIPGRTVVSQGLLDLYMLDLMKLS